MSQSAMVLAAGFAMAMGCAALSPLIVARRWAFAGEGIGHSSFGGAGVVWLLAAIFPTVEALRGGGAAYLGSTLATLVVALGIGRLTRDWRRGGGTLGFDTAVGIFLTASLAVGFLAAEAYVRRFGARPLQADALLFGAATNVTPAEVVAAVGVAVAVIAGLVMFRREVLAYAFDPELAELHGVRVAVVHYALLVATAATVASGARLIGAVLVPGLLVLPGATAATAARGLGAMWAISLATTALAFAAAWGVRALVPAVPVGPAVVLALVAAFVVARLASRRAA